MWSKSTSLCLVYSSSDHCFQQDNLSYHKTQIISYWFHENIFLVVLVYISLHIQLTRKNIPSLIAWGVTNSLFVPSGTPSGIKMCIFLILVKFSASQKHSLEEATYSILHLICSQCRNIDECSFRYWKIKIKKSLSLRGLLWISI